MVKVAKFGQILFFIGLIVAIVGLVFGFGLMFQGGNDIWATRLLVSVAIGFMIMFTGLATSVMFSPHDDNKLNERRSLQDSDESLVTTKVVTKEVKPTHKDLSE
jgi:predicted RND superfamily exporter protein